jgi:hypothetical protein
MPCGDFCIVDCLEAYLAEYKAALLKPLEPLRLAVFQGEARRQSGDPAD